MISDSPVLSRIAKVVCVGWLLFWSVGTISASAQTSPPVPGTHGSIVVLYSYGNGLPAYSAFGPAFRAALVNAGLSNDDLFFEYLDLQRNTSRDYRHELAEMLQRKFSRRNVALVVTIHRLALDFLGNEGKDLFPNQPVIALGGPRTLPPMDRSRQVVFRPARLDFAGTLQMALRIFPATRRVVFVSGAGGEDTGREQEAREAFAPWGNRLKFEYTSGLPLEQMLQRVRSLPPQTIVLCSSVFADVTGQTFIPREVAARIATDANAPVFGVFDTVLGTGVIGGSMLSYQAMGGEAARLALDILKGKSVPQQADAQLTVTKPMFDWAALHRWKVSKRSLPPGSIVVSRPPSLWQQFRRTVLGAIVFGLLQFALICALIVLIRRKSLTQKALRESEARFRVLVQQAPEAIVVIDCDQMRFVEANANAERLFGCGREELLQSDLRRFNVTDAPAGLFEERVWASAKQTYAGEQVSLEIPLRSAQGKSILCAMWLVSLPWNNRKLVRATIRDITDRKRAEEALRRYELLGSRSRDIILFLRCEDGRILEANAAATKAYGYSLDELRALTIHDLRAANIPQLTSSQIAEADARGILFETSHQRKDGSTFPVEVNSQGATVGSTRTLVSVIRDISERKRAEEQLRSTAARLRTILEHAPVGIVINDSEGRLVECNPAYTQIVGYSADELKGIHFKDYTHPDDIANNLELFTDLKKGRLKSFALEKRYIRKDGNAIWVRVIVSTLDGQFNIGIIEDTTVRKHAEQELHETADRLKAILEHAPVGIVIGDKNCFIQTNAAFQRMTGYTADELKGMSFEALTHPDDRALNAGLVHELIGGKRQTYDFEKRYILKDGKIIWVRVVGTRLDDRHKVSIIEDITEKKIARESMQRLARIVESSEDAITSASLDGTLLSWNKGAERLFGYSAAEAIGKPARLLFPEEQIAEFSAITEALAAGRSVENFETVRLTKAGERKPVLITISPIIDDAGKASGSSATMRDLTESKRAQALEEQFRQAQKLEALGRLSGGVAHDFNNLLMVISSYAQMMQDKLAPEDPLRKNTQQVLKAADRAASLTQQLLAFSRKQVLQPQVIDLNSVIGDTTAMVKRLIGEDIELAVLPAKCLWPIKADPSQITQALLNLCVNARDAMPKGGTITIETQNTTVNRQSPERNPVFAPGSYVMLRVTDTGLGMTQEMQQRIFEPFFTTKEQGKGTGLGLATVYGIVKQSGGYIWVDSEPGNGTCFRVYFPRVDEPLTVAPHRPVSSLAAQGETILLVEDEDALREAISDYLEAQGYKILSAPDGAHALRIADQHEGRIDLLLSDVVMPKMSGPELATRLRHRQIPTLFLSGYTDQAILNQAVSQSGAAFIQKPFLLATLGEKVRGLLSTTAQP